MPLSRPQIYTEIDGSDNDDINYGSFALAETPAEGGWLRNNYRADKERLEEKSQFLSFLDLDKKHISEQYADAMLSDILIYK